MDTASEEYMEYLKLHEAGCIAEANAKLTDAVRAQDPLALHTRGYEAEESEPPRIREALTFYKMAARQGYEPSVMNLARHYENLGNARWYLYWLRKAVEMGSPDARRELDRPFPYLVSAAILNFEGRGEVDRAVSAFRLAARHGNVDAMINLANLYDLKFDPPRSTLAEKLYQEAIVRGSGLAAYNLAQHYSDLGDQKNYKKYAGIARRMGYKKEH